MTLEDLMRDAVKRGEFVHLSVYSHGGSFQATFASASRAGGFSSAEAADPVSACMAAIKAAPMVRRRSVEQAVALDDEALG
jgi:hypothetical protein